MFQVFISDKMIEGPLILTNTSPMLPQQRNDNFGQFQEKFNFQELENSI